jgi:peroxiredoxin
MPEFRLAAAGGGEVGVSDYRDRKSLLLWFSKGLFCPYCRRNMARLSQAYAQFQECNAEILQVTINTVKEANLYFRNYRLATPYLCDPELQAHWKYGITREAQTARAVAENIVTSVAMVGEDLLLHGQRSPLPVVPIMRMGVMNQLPQLIVAADPSGVVRHVQQIGPFDTLPTVDELLAVLEPLR